MITATLARHFYRCGDCLSVTAADTEKPVRNAFCGACGGKLEHMGRVGPKGGRMVRDELRCPCDGRCTGAKGPSCDCQCGGANHGSGLLVAVQVDAGAAPKLTPQDAAQAKARAAEYRTALEAARARYRARHTATLDAKAAGRWVDGTAYWSARCDSDAIYKATLARVHAGRMKALAAVCAPKG